MIPIAKPLIGDEEKKAVAEVLASGMLAEGPRVADFEKRFAEYCGTKFAIATSNGTTALHTALLAAGIKRGDEVLTTPFTFIASSNSIIYCGARPVFVDVGEDFNINASKLEEKITPKTKAIIPVHLYGYPCDMAPMMEIAERRNLLVIEDACQAHGAEFNGKKVGSFGKAGCFSFYPTKNMTTGEGGMITTDDEKVADRCRLIRAHGSKVRYYHEAIGYNYRMTDIAAALGLEQLKRLDALNAIRIGNARKLTEKLANIRGLVLPSVATNRKHVFHQYTVRITPEFGAKRDEVAEKLKAAGIGSAVYYPLIVPRQKAYAKLKLAEGEWPVADRASQEVLSIPVHPQLSDGDLDAVAAALRNTANR